MTAHTPLRGRPVPDRRAGWGFTLFELAVVVAVVGVLMVVLLSRLAFYRDQAERLAYEQTVTALRTEVQLQAYALMIAGRTKDIAALAGHNPMNWLAQKPANYLGEYYSPDVKKLASGNWFFDRSDGKLVYLLNQRTIFDPEDYELPKFKVSLTKGSESVAGSVEKLALVSVQVRKEIAFK